MHGPNPLCQLDSSGAICSNYVIPQNISSHNSSDVLTIMAFSSYPDPMTPVDINSESSMAGTPPRLTQTLTQLQDYAEAYGKNIDGPWAGQYKIQGLGVDYATGSTYQHIP